ncbi:10558_t:CDS:1, partial [Gigaspora margarita]
MTTALGVIIDSLPLYGDPPIILLPYYKNVNYLDGTPSTSTNTTTN